MVDLFSIQLFRNHLSTIEETSKDDRDKGHIQYLVHSDKKVINFDDVKDAYVRLFGISATPSSCDAVYQTDNAYDFVEFKAGKMNKTKVYEVEKKIYDTLIIFMDATELNVKDMKKDAVFFLVYTDEANEETRDEGLIRKKELVSDTESYKTFEKKLAAYAKQEIVCFGLEKYKHYCFKDVHTYTVNEFVQYLDGLRTTDVK